MSYQQYGISPALVERVKTKMKNPLIKERVKQALDGVTKADLQNRTKVIALMKKIMGIMNISISSAEASNIVNFVIAQKIDPKNTFHLLKLWGMFR